MSKEITCKVLKEYCTTDANEFGSTKLAEISWNNKDCRGVDIRKYINESGTYSKGITLTYNGLKDIVCSAIENGLVDSQVVEESLEKRKKKIYTGDDFSKLFNRMKHEEEEYTRDAYGRLRDNQGNLVIRSRNKK